MSDAAKNTREWQVSARDATLGTLSHALTLDLEALGARLSALEAKAAPPVPAPSGALVERMAEAMVATKSDCHAPFMRGEARAALAVAAGELLREPTQDDYDQFRQDTHKSGSILALDAFLSRRRAEAGL